MHSLLRIILIGLVACTAACSFQKDGAKEEPASPTVSDLAEELERKRKEQRSNEAIAESDFGFLVEEGKIANSYFIAINFPVKDGVRIFISQDGSQLSPKIAPGTRIPVVGGQKVTFSVTVYNDLNQLLLNFENIIQVPKDLEISGVVPLKENLTEKLGRLILKDDSILITNGKLVSIEAETIIVGPNSQIINFTEQHVISDITQASGGSISIRAKSARGLMVINLRGARGRDGLSGNKVEQNRGYRSASDGQDGHDGQSTYTMEFREGDPERGRPEQYYRDNEQCLFPPTDGQNGSPGPAGADGEDGENGGDTGNIFIQIEDHTNFGLNLSMIPGAPGLPGKGAPGHAGGKGGLAGQQDEDKICGTASNGTNGPKGPDGKDGKEGAVGKLGTYELNGLRNVQLQLPTL